MGTDELKKAVGKRTELEGKAFDAKAGAVIVIDNSIPVYVPTVDIWPSEVLGKSVKVKGTLRYKEHVPVASVDASGAISQGKDPDGDSRDYVIERAEWEIVG
jgi:hypothetical protein